MSNTIKNSKLLHFLVTILIIIPIYLQFLNGEWAFPSTIDLGLLEISSYSLFILSGIAVVAYLFDIEKSNYKELKEIDTTNALFSILLGAIIGARIWHVVTDFHLYQNELITILYIWNGGLGIFGGIIGGFVGAYIYRRTLKTDFLKALSILAVFLPLGQAIGRFGNFVNKELYGNPTDLPWGFYIKDLNDSFHPTFAYEQLGNLILFVILYWYYKKFGPTKNLIVFYLSGYALVRLLVDFTRLEDRVLYDFTVAQITSLILILLAVGYFAKLTQLRKK